MNNSTINPSENKGAVALIGAAAPSDVALRIRRGDTVIEVSSSAPDSVLAFLKDVMINVV